MSEAGGARVIPSLKAAPREAGEPRPSEKPDKAGGITLGNLKTQFWKVSFPSDRLTEFVSPQTPDRGSTNNATSAYVIGKEIDTGL